MFELFLKYGMALILLMGAVVQAQMLDGEFAPMQVDIPSQAPKQAAAPRVSEQSLEQLISVHYEAVTLRELLKVLRPPGWKVQFDIASSKINPTLVFHAETTRRRALNELLLQLGLEGIFYQRNRLVLISSGDHS